ncbi:hypothetical protein CONCODRAFT_11433 [Conidiobolus coronatus NRRL 28638]|uniref:NADH dehydrogenase [ubiquinone] 1 beta subcomplex subunit 2 n=1 Tax=Conidiobolus coronatus (strain ATCC 28846 / CBS 209.66 / NRRL 28638) TaxID=796925 RepID=A0A137NVC4_CONC2|nr:hypothetical protein CONCODRAFT_11433 [Conidiobolus coronatus NRRL 28638]|eukprot:KXN66648.1 hypothetical protein CONCODRAFT_11433 [Conidiobolus coronatus NRRL 28638]
MASGALGPASRVHYYLAKGMGATMWFWIFYRMKQDGAVLFGLRHPWDGHHGHGDHGHGNQGAHH